MPTERIIGIDFGTSTSVVKVKAYRDGQPIDAPELADYVRFDGKSALPTLIYRLDGETLAGYEAENAALGGGGELFANFKLDLISGDGEIKDRAIRLTKDFFHYLYEMYDDQRGNFTPVCDTETTYVSYPAKWPEDVGKMMAEIAAQAGFKNVRGIDEPTAALNAVLIQKGDELRAQGLIQQGKGVNMLMIDMGAGTTDLALCRYTPGKKAEVEILNTWPKADSNVMFGGREVDQALCGYVKRYLVACGLPDTQELAAMCLPQCKRWKEANVSSTLKKPDGLVRACGFTGMFLMGYERREFPPMDRRVFEAMLEGYIGQYPDLVRQCVEHTGGVGPEDIDLVILTGGHSQWYFASEVLSKGGAVELPKVKGEPGRIVSLALPQETVALGMVYQGLSVRVENGGQNTKAKRQEKPVSTITDNDFSVWDSCIFFSAGNALCMKRHQQAPVEQLFKGKYSEEQYLNGFVYFLEEGEYNWEQTLVRLSLLNKKKEQIIDDNHVKKYIIYNGDLFAFIQHGRVSITMMTLSSNIESVKKSSKIIFSEYQNFYDNKFTHNGNTIDFEIYRFDSHQGARGAVSFFLNTKLPVSALQFAPSMGKEQYRERYRLNMDTKTTEKRT